jgi:hypothetical protein
VRDPTELPKCAKGEPCERDRVHAPDRVTWDDLQRLTLCADHREELSKASKRPVKQYP